MRRYARAILVLGVLLAMSAACRAHTADLAGWKTEGEVALDSSRSHSGSGTSIKVSPGARAVKMLRDQDGSGRVSLWVYDDATAPADPKARRAGPCWGVIQEDGTVLIAGILYASYLGGDKGYSAADGKGKFYLKGQWLKAPRKQGWRKWDFVFDAEKGFSLLLDDKPVQFNWNRTSVAGFRGVVLIGDESKANQPQTIWVDDVQADLGGAMKVKPTPPPPPPPFLPEKDPAGEGPPVQLRDSVMGQHPRLLLTTQQIPKLRAFYQSDQAAPYREALLEYLPQCVVPADRKTSNLWGQEVGLFKMPMVALHYVLTGDRSSFDKSVAYLKWLAATANWTQGGEPPIDDTPEAYRAVMEKLQQMRPAGENNSDTTAAFTMVGAALTWDWLYNDLDPTFREQFRQVLWQHARAMYYGGHLGANPGGSYWRNVPMYNHRWFRDWGMTLAAVAATEGKSEEQWFLGRLQKELQFMADWLSPDGSNHEGPGYGSAAGALGMTFQVSDECFGTRHLDVPYFRNVAAFAMQVSAPGITNVIYFADCATNTRSIHPFFLRIASRFQQADVLDGIRQHLKIARKRFGVRDKAWLSLLSDDPEQQGGQYARLPTNVFFPDLGVAIVRDHWREQAVAAMFKCGPPGGYTLNAWRTTVKTADGKLPYINVAHDHPDANSFTLLADGEYLAETNRYPLKPGKLSAGNNTILINGFGQILQGRPEGSPWLQPSSSDMTKMGVITAWKDTGEVMVVEGEAAGSYLAYTDAKTKKSRPPLTRFRRTFIWVKGGYVLVLDDIRAPKPVQVTWLLQGATLQAVDEAHGRYRLGKNKAQCEFVLLADGAFNATIGVSPANERDKLMNWQQLQASAETSAIRFVSVYDPWHHKDVKLTFTPDGKDNATITVSAGSIRDTWKWQAATSAFDAATLHGSRTNGFDVVVNAQTAVPPEPRR